MCNGMLLQVTRRLKSVDVIELLAESAGGASVLTMVRSSSPKPCKDDLHHVWQSVGERLSGEFQCAAACDELPNGEIFYTLRETQVVIESWRRDYNRVRPHGSLGYSSPAPEVVVWPALTVPATQQLGGLWPTRAL